MKEENKKLVIRIKTGEKEEILTVSLPVDKSRNEAANDSFEFRKEAQKETGNVNEAGLLSNNYYKSVIDSIKNIWNAEEIFEVIIKQSEKQKVLNNIIRDYTENKNPGQKVKEIKPGSKESGQQDYSGTLIKEFNLSPGTDNQQNDSAYSTIKRTHKDHSYKDKSVKNEMFKNGSKQVTEPDGHAEDSNIHKETESIYNKEIETLKRFTSKGRLERETNNEAILILEKKYSNSRIEMLNKEYREISKVTMSFVNAATASFGTLWDELIIGGRKAKDPWDAVWLSFRNTALKRIGEILESNIFDEIISSLSGNTQKGKSSGGILGTIISGVFGFLTGGPAGAAVAAGSSAASPGKMAFNDLHNFNPVYSSGSHAIVSTFNKYAEAAQQWQRELKVINDVFENNAALKTVQEYLSKIKS